MKKSAIAMAVLAIGAATVTACGDSDSGTARSSPASAPMTCCGAPASPEDAHGSHYVAVLQHTIGSDPARPISWNITLPQVTGGDAAPRERFNRSMRAAFDDEIIAMRDGAAYSAGTLTDTFVGDRDSDTSRVARISPHLIAGITVYMRTFIKTPHPITLVATAVTDTATAQPITVADMYAEPMTAPAKILALARAIDTSRRLDDRQSVQQDEIANWLPLQSGLLVYFPVVHVLGDYVPVRIPWDQVAPLLKPGMLRTLTG